MTSLLLYTLKLSMLSGIFVGYYWLALRNKRFHYFNRFYLLASLVLSLIIPIIRFDWFANEKPVFIGSGETLDLMLGSTKQISNSISIGDICLQLFMVISIVLIALSGYHIFKIYRLKKQSPITKMEGFDLIQTNEESAPFSFLNNLFWKNTISFEEEGGKQIFTHELTHIQQKHTWDRLFTQLCCSIFWINPFCWVIQKELETIHEFIADEAAVGNENVEFFAKMLLQTHYGNHFFETKHSFFYSSIKRRLIMLTNNTNTRFSYLRRVMLLPLLLMSISFFSIRVHAKEKIETKINAMSESLFQQKIDTTKPPPPKLLTTKEIIFINGKEVVNKEETLKTLKIDQLAGFNILSPEDAIKKYGDKGKNGAIEISMKTNFNASKEKEKDSDSARMKRKVVRGANWKVVGSFFLDSNVNGKENYEKVFTVSQVPASFPGGLSAWVKYLERNLNRDLPIKNGAGVGKYTVIVSFIVDKNGGISDVKAENDPGYGTAEEAKRMIIKGPNWVPATQNGLNVVYRHKQSITFVVSEE
ncbi:MAG: M56 family metallopeptidase [Sediminibacterium sp.]